MLKQTAQHYAKIAEEKGGKLLSGFDEYKNSKTKLKWMCENKHMWKSRPNDIQSGYWCPICKGRYKTIEYCQQLAKQHNGKCLSTEYTNSTTKLEWECENDHQWKTICHVIETGHWCPECGKQKAKETKIKKYGAEHHNKLPEFIERRQKTNLKKYGVKEVSQNREIMLKQSLSVNKSGIIKHWKTNEDCVWRGGYEQRVLNYFNQNKIDFEWQIPFDVPSGKKYFVDAYLPDQDLYIEIKGYLDRNQETKQKWLWFHQTYPNSELWNKKALKEKGIKV